MSEQHNSRALDLVTRYAAQLVDLPQPNQGSTHFQHSDLVDFARKVQSIVSSDRKAAATELMAIARAFPVPQLSAQDEARESVEALYLFAELRSNIFDYVADTYSPSTSEYHTGVEPEIESIRLSLLDIKKQLTELEKDKGALLEGIHIGAFGVHVSLGAVKDIIDQARKETEKRGLANLRYLSSLMRAANEISGAIWRRVRLAASSLAVKAVHILTVSVASTASKAMVIYLKTLEKSGRVKSTGYSLEAAALSLSRRRETLIALIEDFEQYHPGRSDLVLSSALSQSLQWDTRDEYRAELSKNYVTFLELEPSHAHAFVLSHARKKMDRLSREILETERMIQNQKESKA